MGIFFLPYFLIYVLKFCVSIGHFHNFHNGPNFTHEKLKPSNEEYNYITDLFSTNENETDFNTTSFEIPFSAKLTAKHFYLFTNDFRKGMKYEVLDPLNITSMKSCHFATRKTYILVHGFTGYGLEPWILSIKDALLQREDSNVISVDWPAGTRWFAPSYYEAAGRVSYVGNDTAFLLSELIKRKGLELPQVHCIGHSLGGHVCGFAGKPFEGRMGRISGLDPAGPRFQKLNSSSRLDRKDATYVDVIHTNACGFDYWLDCYGLGEDIGHSDFYPNGGKHQPGCPSRYINTVGGDIGCSHQMAYRYYSESLDYALNNTLFLARPCDDWYNYTEGFCPCGKLAQFMGINVNTELDGQFYVATHSFPPFAQDDPECTDKRWNMNFLVIIGYVLIACAVLIFLITVFVIFLRNVRKCLCAQEVATEDTNNLVEEVDDDESRVSGVEEDLEDESLKFSPGTS